VSDVLLIDQDGVVIRRRLAPPPALTRPGRPIRSRMAYAATHVVPKPWAANTPGTPADIDWDRTLAFRHHIWSWGLGVADAMDTAQRNMGLDPVATRELVDRSAAEATSVKGALVVGVNTDAMEDDHVGLDRIVDAYVEQLEHAEDVGAGVVLMASRHLARAATGPSDYERVYDRVIARAGAPVILHWLGSAFDPVLEGYFGSSDTSLAAGTVRRIIADHRDRVTGIKMSLLSAESEIALRAVLPEGSRMFTGDDFHYVSLIEGDGQRHSDALLGAFAAIAPTASAALQRLDDGDVAGYREILQPTEALARTVFEAPTYHYKTGIAFLSWLNGHQEAFSMVGGLQSARSLFHLATVVRLADEAGALERPDLAAERWGRLLSVFGVPR
jgi:hypothetical protein